MYMYIRVRNNTVLVYSWQVLTRYRQVALVLASRRVCLATRARRTCRRHTRCRRGTRCWRRRDSRSCSTVISSRARSTPPPPQQTPHSRNTYVTTRLLLRNISIIHGIHECIHTVLWRLLLSYFKSQTLSLIFIDIIAQASLIDGKRKIRWGQEGRGMGALGGRFVFHMH